MLDFGNTTFHSFRHHSRDPHRSRLFSEFVQPPSNPKTLEFSSPLTKVKKNIPDDSTLEKPHEPELINTCQNSTPTFEY